jgi:tungstate transport system substrate-binding protein
MRARSLIPLLALASGLFSSNVLATDSAQTLRVLGANTTVETGIIHSLAKQYMESHPGVSIEIETAGALAVLDRARQGRGDIVITHHPRAEELFVSDGFGINRTQVMYNSFAILGPNNDPLGLSNERDLLTVLRTLAKEQVAFVTPGRRSGTTTRLNELWTMVNTDPSWVGYETTEASAKATIQNADLYEAYTFADLGTYFSNQEKIKNIRPLYRDNVALNNYYSAIVVNGNKVNGINQKLAESFLDFLVSDQAQMFIGQFGIGALKTSLYTPAAQFDNSLRERRLKSEIAAKNRSITVLSMLGAVIAGALTIVVILLLKARRLAINNAISEERFRLAALDSKDGLYDWDLKEDVAYFSPQFRTLLGISGDKDKYTAPSQVLIEHISESHRKRMQAKLMHAMAGSADHLFTTEFTLSNTSLSGRWLLFRGRIIRNPIGVPIRMCGVLSDVTAAHMHESAPASSSASPKQPRVAIA